MRDWNLRHKRGQKCRGVENARLENGAPEMQGRKMREKQTRATCVVNVVTKMKCASKATTACKNTYNCSV